MSAQYKTLKAQTRNGFSLTDAIFSIAVLSAVIAILMPTIQSIREAARISVCQDRLAEIAIESLDYEAIHCFLPCQLGAPGCLPDFNEWGFGTSSPNYWRHQQNLSPMALAATTSTEYDLDPIWFDVDKPLNEFFMINEDWADLSVESRPRYLCPSATQLNSAKPTIGFTVVLQPLESYNDDLWGFVSDPRKEIEYGRTNFVGCNGAAFAGGFRRYDEFWHYRGLVSSREKISVQHVVEGDGMTNTIMYGESIGQVTTQGRRTELNYAHAWLSGGIVRGRGRTSWQEASSPQRPLLGNVLHSAFHGFGSTHRDGVNFAFGDGAVQKISRSIDTETFYQLCGAFDTQ